MNHKIPQNATPSKGLSPNQEIALGAMLAGQSKTEAAKAAGVDRTTIYRWLKDPTYPAFRNALNSGRKEMRQAVHGRLLAMAEKAAKCLEAELGTGNGKLALGLLKGLGYLQ